MKHWIKEEERYLRYLLFICIQHKVKYLGKPLDIILGEARLWVQLRRQGMTSTCHATQTAFHSLYSASVNISFLESVKKIN